MNFSTLLNYNSKIYTARSLFKITLKDQKKYWRSWSRSRSHELKDQLDWKICKKFWFSNIFNYSNNYSNIITVKKNLLQNTKYKNYCTLKFCFKTFNQRKLKKYFYQKFCNPNWFLNFMKMICIKFLQEKSWKITKKIFLKIYWKKSKTRSGLNSTQPDSTELNPTQLSIRTERYVIVWL